MGCACGGIDVTRKFRQVIVRTTNESVGLVNE